MRITYTQPSSNQPKFKGFSNVVQGVAGRSCAVITAQCIEQSNLLGADGVIFSGNWLCERVLGVGNNQTM